MASFAEFLKSLDADEGKRGKRVLAARRFCHMSAALNLLAAMRS
jgi:hypothetical protein